MNGKLQLGALVFLGVAGLFLVGGMVACATTGKPVPAELAGACGSCLGALGGFLAAPQRPSGPLT